MVNASRQDEYLSLRQELIEHQARRLNVMNWTFAAIAAILTASLGLKLPYVPLTALPVIVLSLIQLTQALCGGQRISSYLRVMHEEGNSELNWETCSYAIRREGASSSDALANQWSVSPLQSLSWLLFSLSVAVLVVAAALAWPSIPQNPAPVEFRVTLAVAGSWLIVWLFLYRWAARRTSTSTDDEEAAYWQRMRLNQTGNTG